MVTRHRGASILCVLSVSGIGIQFSRGILMRASLSNTLMWSNGAMWCWSGHCDSFLHSCIFICIIQSCHSFVLWVLNHIVLLCHSCGNCPTLVIFPLCGSFHSFMLVGALSILCTSFIQISISSRWPVGAGVKFNHIFRVHCDLSPHGIHSIGASHLYVPHRSIVPVRSSAYQASTVCIQLPTSPHTIFLHFYIIIFITFRSSYNLLCCQTLLQELLGA
jgi:hypothetical protein